jgi:hypothetical protein
VSKVRIGTHAYQIVYVDKVGDSDDWGQADFDALKIWLSTELQKPEMASKWAEIVLHEAAHIILSEVGVEFPADEAEERCVTQLAKGLTQFMLHNKTLVRALLKALK